jgi:hypothetical protein
VTEPCGPNATDHRWRKDTLAGVTLGCRDCPAVWNPPDEVREWVLCADYLAEQVDRYVQGGADAHSLANELSIRLRKAEGERDNLKGVVTAALEARDKAIAEGHDWRNYQEKVLVDRIDRLVLLLHKAERERDELIQAAEDWEAHDARPCPGYQHCDAHCPGEGA